MHLSLQDNLPFVTVYLTHNDRELEIPNVLIDTGSGGTMFAADIVAEIGIIPPNSPLFTVQFNHHEHHPF
jgi:hypothetical protein